MSETPGSAPLMLGVSGLRGIVGRSLTPEVAARFAGAVGRWLVRERRRFDRHKDWPKGPIVIVGADGRAGYKSIRDAALEGLRDAGCLAVDHGIVMTPTMGVLADHDDADGALIVAASHNPQQWNGLKCLVRPEVGTVGGVVSASAPSAALAAEILSEYGRVGAASAGGRIDRIEGDATAIHLGPVLSEIGEFERGGTVQRRRIPFDS